MNRRSFFSTLVKGVGVFSILPPAETYSRIWKATREPIGIYEQLAACDSILQEPVNLDNLFDAAFAMLKRRKTNLERARLQNDLIFFT